MLFRAFAALGLCAFFGTAVLGQGSMPWLASAPLTASAKEIAATAGYLPARPGLTHEVLLHRVNIEFDSTGRQRQTSYRVWRLAHAAAIDKYGMLEAHWAPWYQRRPEIRARVISPNGLETPFDPSHIAEETVQSSGKSLSDRKRLRGPLPALAVGSIVEELINTEEERPSFSAGIVERVPLMEATLAYKLQFRLDAPTALPLKCEVRGGNQQVIRKLDGGRVTYTIEMGPLEPLKQVEPFQTLDPTQLPAVWISTAESWKAVATGYAALAEKQIDPQAVRSVVQGALKGNEPRDEIISRLFLRTQEIVRYTSLAFGESAIVPCKPQETLTRQFGDCKDQSALLVALLRCAGVPAQLALMRVGQPDDLSPDFPGMGMFDHCIVHVPGVRPLWLDPTFSLGRPLELPMTDKGRFALIISQDTTALTRTPARTSRDNFLDVRREMVFDRSGRGKYVEVGEFGGLVESIHRATQQSQTVEAYRLSLEESATKQFLTKRITAIERADPAVRTKPFKTKVELADARLATGSIGELSIDLPSFEALSALPDYFVSAPGSADSKTNRKTPLRLNLPYVSHLEWRIVPPAGMRPKEVPAPIAYRWGPATLRTELRVQPNQELIAKVELDTGEGLLSPADVDAMRRDLAGLGRNGSFRTWKLSVKYELPAWRLAAERKWSAAFTEFRRLVNEDPQDAAVRGLYVECLVKAGLRDAAKTAIAVMPRSAQAHSMLGWALSHDPAGRHMQPGMDLTGAETAFRKAVDLGDSRAIWWLAFTLEHDPHGNRYGDGQRLNEAISLYRRSLSLEESEPTRASLCTALLASGQFPAFKTEVEKLPNEARRKALWPLAIALTQGTAAAWAAIDELGLTTDGRRSAVAGLVTDLDYLRRYDQAVEMLESPRGIIAGDRGLQAQLARLKLQKRFEDIVEPAGTPVRVVQAFLADSLAGEMDDATCKRYAATNCLLDAGLIYLQSALRSQLPQGRPFSPQRRLDVLALLKCKAEGGAESGYRVTLEGRPLQNKPVRTYVVRRDDGYRLLFGGNYCAELGTIALEELTRGRPEGARQWLQWAEEALKASSTFNPNASAYFWFSSRLNKTDPQALALWAASLAAGADDPTPTIEVLGHARNAEPFKKWKVTISSCLLTALLKAGRLEDAQHLLNDGSFSTATAKRSTLQLLLRQNNADDLRVLVNELLEEKPDDAYLLDTAIRGRQLAGDFVEADRMLSGAALANPAKYANNRAWNLLFIDRPPRESLEAALRTLQAEGATDHTQLHTLASVQAELGDPAAIETLRQAIDNSVSRTVQNTDWYVLGRIAESNGLATAAREAYRRVTGEPGTNAFSLAQRRLEQIRLSQER